MKYSIIIQIHITFVLILDYSFEIYAKLLPKELLFGSLLFYSIMILTHHLLYCMNNENHQLVYIHMYMKSNELIILYNWIIKDNFFDY